MGGGEKLLCVAAGDIRKSSLNDLEDLPIYELEINFPATRLSILAASACRSKHQSAGRVCSALKRFLRASGSGC